jgi:uncharacterized protein (DUF342 family)
MENPRIGEIALNGNVLLNGKFDFSLDERAQTARVSLYPPSGTGAPVTEEMILTALSVNSVFYGINHDAIKEALDRCAREHLIIRDLVIASGTPPVDEEAGYYRIRDELLNKPKVIETDKAIDYKEINPFVIVAAGDVIADIIPPKAGVPGKSLSGEEIPFGTRERAPLEPGKNTQIMQSTVLALTPGRLIFEGLRFWVNETLTITGDIDYHTGNISYPGDVEIKGIIQEGFTLTVGGSLNLYSTVDATKIMCRENLASTGGLIGHGEGMVLVGGEVKARFVQNCHLESLKTIQILKSIVNSLVFCLGDIQLGKNGTIVNSQIHTRGNLSTFQIGTTGSQSTVIHCGVDFMAERKLDKYKNKLLKVNELLERLKDLEQKSGKGNLAGQKAELETEMQEYMKTVTEALNSLDVNDNAQVIVTGSVFPGSIIKICSLSYTVQEEMKHVAFTIDKKLGRIQVRNLKQGTG